MKSLLRENLRSLFLPLELSEQRNLRAVMSRFSADFMPKLEQKMFNDTSSGRDKSGLDAKRHKNLGQAAPMDSSSDCLKSRISIGREFMHLSRENE